MKIHTENFCKISKPPQEQSLRLFCVDLGVAFPEKQL